ncbi:MAG: flippase [Candidatus Eisenbacteria bacterium]|nr:flippase [Candidatus Eisenbacteria bacterium]
MTVFTINNSPGNGWLSKEREYLDPLKQSGLAKETIAKSLSIVMILAFAQRLIGIVKAILFARLLGPHNYGIYGLAFNSINLIVTFCGLGIPSSYIRYVTVYEEQGSLKDFLAKTIRIGLGVSFLVGLCFFIFSGTVSRLIYGDPREKNVIMWIGLVVVPLVLAPYISSAFSGLRVFKRTAVLELSHMVLFCLIGVPLVLLIGRRVESVMAGEFIAISLVVAFFSRSLFKSLSAQNLPVEEKGFHRKILRFSVWFVVIPFELMLFNYMDRWFINHKLGSDQVGIYTVAAGFTELALMVGIVIGRVLAPHLSHAWEKGEKEKAMRTMNLAMRLSLMGLFNIAVLLHVLSPILIRLLFGTAYAGAAQVIAVLLIYQILKSLYWIVSIYPSLIEKTRLPLLSVTIGVILNGFLNYLLIPRIGILGAAIAGSGAFLVLIALFLFHCSQRGLIVESRSILCIIFVPLLALRNDIALVGICVALLTISFFTPLVFTAGEKKLLREKLSFPWWRAPGEPPVDVS